MSGTILAVDDSKTVRASLKYALSNNGFEIELAENGRKGLEILSDMDNEGWKPDMIISDINMPVMDGITFIKEVKGEPKYKYIPILVLTTESQEAKKMEGKEAGAAGWLVKPFSNEQLLAVVNKFVR
ncbi:MAG: response regulator [Halanaerobiales bacterium]